MPEVMQVGEWKLDPSGLVWRCPVSLGGPGSRRVEGAACVTAYALCSEDTHQARLFSLEKEVALARAEKALRCLTD